MGEKNSFESDIHYSDFRMRRMSAIALSFLFYFVGTFIVLPTLDFGLRISISLLMFSIPFAIVMHRYRYSIELIEIDSKNVYVRLRDFGKLVEMRGPLSEFSFRIGQLFIVRNAQFLEIKREFKGGSIKVRQHAIGDWNTAVFKKVKHAFVCRSCN